MDLEDYPQYKASISIWQVVPPMLIALGSFGNVLTIIVLTRKKSRNSSTAVYLSSLAVSDVCVLYTGLLRQWVKYTFDVDIRNLTDHGCRLHIFMVYFFTQLSSWLLVAVTMERVIGAWCPHKVKMGCTSRSAGLVIGVIALFLFFLNVHWFVGMGATETIEGNETYTYNCDTIYDDYNKFLTFMWPWIDLCFFCLIPFFVLLIGNVAIIVKVFASTKRSRTLIAPQAASSALNTNGSSSVTVAPATAKKKSSDKTASLTAMLFTLNAVFFACATPISIFLIGEPHFVSQITTLEDVALYYLWWAIVNILMYSHNAINFILYFLSGSRFRQEVKNLFCGGTSVSIFGLKTTIGSRVAPRSTVQTVADSVA